MDLMKKTNWISVLLIIGIICSGLGFEFSKTEVSFSYTDSETHHGDLLIDGDAYTLELVSTRTLNRCVIENERNGSETESKARTLLSVSELLLNKSVFMLERARTELLAQNDSDSVTIVTYIQKKDGKKS